MQTYFDLAGFRLSLWQQLPTNHDLLISLYGIESYWAYPGKAVLFQLSHYLETEDFSGFSLLAANTLDALCNEYYKKQEFTPFYSNLDNLNKPQSKLLQHSFAQAEDNKKFKAYFEVLIIHPNPGFIVML